ncbi:cytochrome c oxidase subunit 1 [Gonapodya sp. JEL0774]|nr:cytochrome c oxidase subunit 1 [Gonapodya sp. JEL0774]
MSAGTDDMIQLDELTEESILNNLRVRYEKKIIYTLTGTILVALNPYEVQPIFSQEYIKRHRGSKLTDNPPHIFAVAEAAYANVLQNRKNQGVIISGESGAGKSESTKYILQYLTAVTTQANQESWVEQQILESNTILEAFGNAKTVRNNNSSRFGKFIQIQFGKTAQITGAQIVNYLLEKSRVTRQAPSERNYHCFYHMVIGASPEEKQKYQLLEPSAYFYLNQSGCVDIPGVNDTKHWQALKLAMTVLGMTPADIEGCFRVLSAVLHLGNVKFTPRSGGEQSEVSNKDTLDAVCGMIGCDAKKLAEVLCFKRLTIRNETTLVNLKPDQAADNRDAVAKNVYDGLFQRLVEVINAALKKKDEVGDQCFVGVLDIFGFEVFQINSFEQLCINFTNEKLQQFFNQFIFKLEQIEYEKEKIQWSKINFVDNQGVIDLIEAKLGILGTLDEETRFPKGSDETWLSKMNDAFAKPPNSDHYVKPKTAKGVFGIRHYAGEVMYTVQGFLEKNRDSVQPEVFALVENSQNQFVATLFAARVEALKNAPGGKAPTSSTNFKNSLNALVSTLTATTPHYVRCIKPNPNKVAFEWNLEMVTAQLRYSGLLDTVKIRKAGYPVRLPFADFVANYKCLAISKVTSDATASCFAIVKAAGLSTDLVQAGATKIFLRLPAVNVLASLRDKIYKEKGLIIAKNLRAYVARKNYLKKKAAAIKVEKNTRGWLARQMLRRMIEARQKARKDGDDPKRKEQEKSAAQKEEEARRQVEEDRMKALQEEMQKMRAAQSEGDGTAESPETAALDNLFAFLGDFQQPNQGKPAKPKNEDLSRMFDNLNAEIGQMTIKRKQTQKVPDSEENLAQSGTNLALEKKLRSNGRIKDLVEMGSADSIDAKDNFDINAPEFSMKAYGEKYFEFHSKTSGTLAKKTKMLDIQDMLTYTKDVIPMSICRLPALGEKLVEIPCETFKLLFKVLEANWKKPDDAFAAAKKIITIGIEYPELRDEIFVQICRQVSEPAKVPKNWNEIRQNGWIMMALATSAFPAGKAFSKFLLAFIRRTEEQTKSKDKEDQSTLHKLVVMARAGLKQISLNGPKRLPPSSSEIQAVVTTSPVMCRVQLLDGQVKVLPTDLVMTASQAIKDLSRRIDLKDSAGWSLYECRGKDELLIKHKEYISDLLSKWEKLDGSIGQGSPSLATAKGHKKEATNSSTSEPRIVMKRRVFRNPQEILSDPTEYHLLAAQAADNVAKDVYPLQERIAIQLAALRLQTINGDFTDAQKSKLEKLDAHVPPSIYGKQQPSYWSNAVIENYKLLKGKSPMQAEVLYLEAVKGFRTYGATFFPAKYKGFWSFAENVLLVISLSGVEFMHPKSKATILTFPFAQIQSWNFTNDTVTFNVFKISNDAEKENENGEEAEIVEHYSFLTPRSEEICLLLKDYAPAKSEKKVKKEGYGDIDYGSAKRDVDKARQALLAKKCMRVPGPDGPRGLASSTVKKLQAVGTVSKARSTVSLRKLAQGDASSMDALAQYFEADWAYSKVRVEFPLTNLGSQDLEEQAVNFYIFLQTYCGIVPPQPPFINTDPPVAPFSSIIQQLLTKCIEEPLLCNEMYMQLIKITTENPEIDSPISIAGWKLLCVAVGVIAPTAEFLDYLKAHIRKCMTDDPKAKKQRVGEQQFAKFAHKTLLKTIATGNRKCPPSTDEIIFVSKLSNIRMRFHFADGTFRAMMVEASAIVGEIFEQLKEKCNLKGSKGFAVYESFGGLERAMDSREKIADIIFKWDNFARATQSREKLKFTFKKRLFLTEKESNDAEEELVRYQVMNDIRWNRFPLTEEEATDLVALQAQVEYGDHRPDAKIPYAEFITRFLPETFHKPGLDQDVAIKHSNLKGETARQVQKHFLHILKQWPLFGSTVFEVSQSYSSEMPTDCWLAVNATGVHILARQGKDPLISCPYDTIASYSPSQTSIMIVTESVTQGVKYVFSTIHAAAIGALMKDYVEALVDANEGSLKKE